MKKIKYLMGIMVVVFTFSNCTDDNADLPQETIIELNKSSDVQLNRNSVNFNGIISAGEEFVFEIPSDHIEDNSHYFSGEFKSIETMNVVRYNDFHLLKITGQNLNNSINTQYYSMDEIIGSRSQLRASNGGGNRNYCSSCPNGVLIYYYYMRADGTLYLRNTKCFPCPEGLQHALAHSLQELVQEVV